MFRGIDDFYKIQKRAVKMAEAYTEIKGLANVLKMCRLKAVDVVIYKDLVRTKLFYHWMDEYNNLLTINRDKSIKVTYNTFSINFKNTDIYYGLSIKNIAKISTHVLCFYGICDFDLECCILLFLGIDGYLRAYLYSLNEWSQVSPLLIGMNNLLEFNDCIENKKMVLYGTEFKKLNSVVLPCAKKAAWLSCMASEEMTELFNKCNYIKDIIT